ncbi:unnamed protein product, partial [Rotaria sp. Silwood1]
GSRNYYPLSSPSDMYSSLARGIIDAAFEDNGVATYITNNIYCNLTLVGNDFDKSVFGIITHQKWLYKQDLDVNILLLREAGDLERLKQKWFEAQNCPDSSQTSTAIGIEATSGLFMVFGVISILSLLLFAWRKRHNIKNYLFRLISLKNSSAKTKDSMDRRSGETSEHSQNHETASPCILYL